MSNDFIKAICIIAVVWLLLHAWSVMDKASHVSIESHSDSIGSTTTVTDGLRRKTTCYTIVVGQGVVSRCQ